VFCVHVSLIVDCGHGGQGDRRAALVDEQRRLRRPPAPHPPSARPQTRRPQHHQRGWRRCWRRHEGASHRWRECVGGCWERRAPPHVGTPQGRQRTDPWPVFNVILKVFVVVGGGGADVGSSLKCALMSRPLPTNSLTCAPQSALRTNKKRGWLKRNILGAAPNKQHKLFLFQAL
jgi:hypothetical protein